MNILTALQRLWPNGDRRDPGLLTGIAAGMASALQPYGITDLNVVAHILAQISHQCGAGIAMVETMDFSAERILQMWPNYFDQTTARQYAHNPQALANFIYNPPCHRDLGNVEGSQDGWNYRGRGATQIIGRAKYDRLGNETALPLIDHPDMVTTPEHFIKVGVADFVLCGCLPHAANDDLRSVTLFLTGGLNGLQQRQVWLARWKDMPLDL